MVVTDVVSQQRWRTDQSTQSCATADCRLHSRLEFVTASGYGIQASRPELLPTDWSVSNQLTAIVIGTELLTSEGHER